MAAPTRISQHSLWAANSTKDLLSSASLFVVFAALYSLTRSHWLDDWDSVNFAFSLRDFDLPNHWPHPPGYPVYVAAARLVHVFIPDPAATLTFLSALAGASAVTMFYVLSRRYLERQEALVASLAMAFAPLFWLQAGLALTDMFGLLFLLAFMLAEGFSPGTKRGETIRLIHCGAITGLSLGARPHFTLLILAYWFFRGRAGTIEARPLLIVLLSFLFGVAVWLLPAAYATGGLETYFRSCLTQFQWRFNKPAACALVWPLDFRHLASRAIGLLGEIGQAIAPRHITKSDLSRRVVLSLFIIIPYVFFAWRSPAAPVARPYLRASAIYLVMLFLLLPVQHQRYLLPLTPILGWAAGGVVTLFRKPLRKAIASIAFIALSLVPSLSLVGSLSKNPPPVQAIDWLRTAHPDAVLYSSQLFRHAAYYWPNGVVRGQPKVDGSGCAGFLADIASSRPVVATAHELCGIKGERLALFKRDRRIHDKHARIEIYRFASSGN